LLPVASEVIRNPAFRDALPVIDNILESGHDVWQPLLPPLADLVYDERFPHTFDDLLTLFSGVTETDTQSKDYAGRIKFTARFLSSRMEGGENSVAWEILQVLDDLNRIELPHTTLREYLDQLNVKGVITGMYEESGALRGEELNPKLNADPVPEELEKGESWTPAQRRRHAMRLLFRGGAEAPIVQLAGLVREFDRPHQNFLPALASWFAANGDRVSSSLFDYVAKAMVRSALPKINLEIWLKQYAEKLDQDLPKKKVGPREFVSFLRAALADSAFDVWMDQQLFKASRESFGEKNARFLSRTNLKQQILEIYRLPQVADFGATLIPEGKTLPLGSAYKRWANLHRSDKLEVPVAGEDASLDEHLTRFWLDSARDSMGESVIVKFVMDLAQTFFTDFAGGFAAKHPSISKWYYKGAYSSPDSTESMAAYAFQELNLLKVWEEKRGWLKEDFAREVFRSPEDLAAFRYFVDQVPNIWLYVRSGMMRSGADLTRLLSERDKGYLIHGYVDLITVAVDSGLLARAVPILHQYQEERERAGLSEEPDPLPETLEERRKTAKGADALRRVLHAILEPKTPGDYGSTVLSRILVPLNSLVQEGKRRTTERFLLTASRELLATPDEKINRFFRGMNATKRAGGSATDRGTLRGISDMLKDDRFPRILHALNRFFRDDAVRPALDYLAEKIDDGAIDRILLFVRRVLGFRS
ncbi:MAG: hypothetical protein HUU37_00720, partial [Bdellovibrionales bacterium]|nr:hypothetical protein [Bdellovibrionales bacterium]